MKILHITYHSGCKLTVDFIAKSFGYEVETQIADWNYNIGHERAKEVWNKYKDFYNQFDVVITSDTAALSRIFLQNNFSGKLVIWVCNRFDYADQASNDCKFPDPEYYQLFNQASKKKNVKIFSYTKFEHEYAGKYKNTFWDNTKILKPCSSVEDKEFITLFPPEIDKSKTFFIPQYHNETIFMNLKSKCDELKIPSYVGRYSGPIDLKGIKGLISIPYGWSTLALFENWSIGNVYFIPSKKFLLTLSKQHNFWWQDSHALDALIESSEWYLPEHQELFIYFDNWDHLKHLSEQTELLQNKKNKVAEFSKNHTEKTLLQWRSVFNDW